MSMIINPYRFGGAGGTSFAAAVLALSPWGYWKLDETGTLTTAADSSGNARHGTYQGSGTTGGAGGLFAGSSSAVTLNGSGRASFPTMGPVNGVKVTALACIKTSAAATQHIISSDDNVGGRRCWQWRLTSSGRMELVIHNVGTVVPAIGDVINDNLPHMVALVFDPTVADAAGKVKVYCDGVQKYASTTNIVITSTADTKPCFGSRSSELQVESFTGTGDECALWTGRALTGTEISDLWTARNTP